MSNASTSSKTVARWTWTRVELEDLRHLGYISRHKTGEFVNFADYDSREGELLAEIERLRGALDRIGNPRFVYSSDDDSDEDTQLSMRMADARASLKGCSAHEREMTPSAWLVKLDDGWRYLGSTKEDAERTQREKGGVIVPLYESLRDETSAYPLRDHIRRITDHVNKTGLALLSRDWQQVLSELRAVEPAREHLHWCAVNIGKDCNCWCDHPRSELLASKGDTFEMRKCLECTKIFRVRLPEKAGGGDIGNFCAKHPAARYVRSYGCPSCINGSPSYTLPSENGTPPR